MIRPSGSLRAFLAAALLPLAALTIAHILTTPARADEGWVITSFDATYAINEDGTVRATEDIRVDFGAQEHHGIFRDIPVEYEYDKDNNRLIRLTGITVDDGSNAHPFEAFSNGKNLRIKIGDPDVLVSGEQRYRIQYTINRGLNPFPDHDEFYWNVTGNDWPVTIEAADATVVFPTATQFSLACYVGPVGSTAPCVSDELATMEGAVFLTDSALPEGSGLTIVLGVPKGVIDVGPPELVDANETIGEQVSDFLGLSPGPIIASLALLFAGIAAVIRQWWIAGRDRWYGDMFHVADRAKSETKPLGAHESIVTEFTPPEVDGAVARRLRPAEIGLLVDEKADTLDVTATIVDLAVQKRLVIKETEEGGVLGLFKKKDYELEKLEAPEAGMLPYEKKLLDSLFDDGSPVKLSDLKNKFYKDLAKVKEQLYREVTTGLKFFPRDPDTTRNAYLVAGIVIAGVGGILTYLLGAFLGAGIVGIPVIVAGILLLALSPSMPRRTADGRVMYRRCLGFRRYIETAETARQEFAEKANLFQEYLPYAIVFRCVDKWAKAFEGLDDEATRPGWYYGRGPFMAAAFASSVNDFSESISSVMASTPGGRGGSGFGGGGFSGGGGGGGGGGSW
ncbi:MAG TPA: DUF2207 domain-containing protein [Dehalococcoidia bacterium]|nr:DUF2207 domain-containing protein [Dehalococcoidia bacterium]